MIETNNREKIHTGELYFPNDTDLWNEQLQTLHLLEEYNQLSVNETGKQKNLLTRMFAEIGHNCYIQPPLQANWGGKNVHFGNDIYANFNLTLVDDTDIFVDNHVMFGPNVVLITGSHPISPKLRKKGMQYNRLIHIEKNVWLGAGEIVLPGITIGENSVIGAGSVVTKDIPSNVVAVGNPCKILHKIE